MIQQKRTPELEAQVNRVLGINPENETVERLAKENLVARSIAEKLEKSLKPLGYYNIPEILDKRRLEYGIPNGAFELYPSFDKVFIHQIPMVTRDTYAEGGVLLRPDQVKSWDKNTAPRGILISAGLQAMDSLYSAGVQVGHIVRFKKFSPFIMPVDDIDGYPLSVMVLRDGDIEASEDMADAINAKRGQIINVCEDGKTYDFRYVENGKVTGKKVSPYYDASM